MGLSPKGLDTVVKRWIASRCRSGICLEIVCAWSLARKHASAAIYSAARRPSAEPGGRLQRRHRADIDVADMETQAVCGEGVGDWASDAGGPGADHHALSFEARLHLVVGLLQRLTGALTQSQE
jgi:hypothetical protein